MVNCIDILKCACISSVRLPLLQLLPLMCNTSFTDIQHPLALGEQVQFLPWIIICYTWIGNNSVNYTKLYIMEKQSLLIRLRESPQLFMVKCYKCLCNNVDTYSVFLFPRDSDSVFLFPVIAIGSFCCLNSTITHCYEPILKLR